MIKAYFQIFSLGPLQGKTGAAIPPQSATAKNGGLQRLCKSTSTLNLKVKAQWKPSLLLSSPYIWWGRGIKLLPKSIPQGEAGNYFLQILSK